MLSLEELACNTERIFGISCRFKCKSGVPIRNHEIGKNLYRIVQEAVNNAIKHGNAKNIEIGLDCSDNRIRLTVQDDGVGFPANGKNNKGMGVKIMRTRAQSIGASLTIQRASAGGTIITCSI
jgi:signal transduction histidine kinase